MRLITMLAFEEELGHIKVAEGMIPKALPKITAPFKTTAQTVAKSWKHAPAHPPEVQKALGSLFSKYTMSKGAGAAGALGAMGGGLSLLHGGLKEWDRRSAENRILSSTKPEQHAQAKQVVDASRLHRLKRLGVNTALAAGTGALVGHYGQKAVKGLSETASKGMAENLKPALEEALAKGHEKGLQEGSRGVVWKALNPFKKK